MICPNCGKALKNLYLSSKFVTCESCGKLYTKQVVDAYWAGYLKGVSMTLDALEEKIDDRS